MRILRSVAYRAQPWKNGAGVTREILRVPDEASFAWRLSIADIRQSGPFSDFTGYRRFMVLLQGNGVALKGERFVAHSLDRVGELVAFDGGLTMQGDLISGPCVDLNLMVANRLNHTTAEVRQITGPIDVAQKPLHTLVVFCINDSVSLYEGARLTATLDVWDCVISEPPAEGEASAMRVSPRQDASIFIAQIPPVEK